MAFNRTTSKIESLIVSQASATANKFVLGEETKSAILALVNEYNYLSDFGASVAISALTQPNQGSIVVFKQPNVSLLTKTDVGPGPNVKGTLDTVSIAWQKPRYVSRVFSAYDISRGLVQASAAFIAKAVEEGSQSRQLKGFEDLVSVDSKKTANTLSAAVLGDAKQFRDRILKEASSFLKIVNNVEGIKGVKMENIVIHISAEESYKLLDIIGDLASKQYENGLYTTTKLGGFNIRVNDLLGRVAGAPKVIIATDFVYKSFHAIVGAKTELINGSFDTVAYYEDAIAQGHVYTGLIKVLY